MKEVARVPAAGGGDGGVFDQVKFFLAYATVKHDCVLEIRILGLNLFKKTIFENMDMILKG